MPSFTSSFYFFSLTPLGYYGKEINQVETRWMDPNTAEHRSLDFLDSVVIILNDFFPQALAIPPPRFPGNREMLHPLYSVERPIGPAPPPYLL